MKKRVKIIGSVTTPIKSTKTNQNCFIPRRRHCWGRLVFSQDKSQQQPGAQTIPRTNVIFVCIKYIVRSNGQNSALSILCQKGPQREWVTHDVHVAPMWHMAPELFSICAASSMQLWDMSRIYSFPHSSFGCWMLSLYPIANAFSSSIRWEKHFVLPNFASSHQWTHVFNRVWIFPSSHLSRGTDASRKVSEKHFG